MSMDKATLEAHIKAISETPNIRNKIVILCEGRVVSERIRSPQDYKKLLEVADADFYWNCIPDWWKQRKPEFFTCGSRQGVMDTYFGLLEYQKQSPTMSYLNPNKLFALVDLDLQPGKIPNYQFPDFDAIFADLYHQAEVNQASAPHHRIWVTGLLHKEAYFFHPMLQDFFDNYPSRPMFEQKPLNLKDMYFTMSQTMDSDPNLKQHFAPRLCQRITFCPHLDCQSLADLKQSWQTEFQKLTDMQQNLALIYSLLLLVKSKEYWQQIESDPKERSKKKNEQYKNELYLGIAKHISAKAPANHHLSVFFETLYQHELNHRSNA